MLHHFAATVPELPLARARLRRWLDGLVDDVTARQDLLLVGTELCTEAVQRDASGLVTLRAWIEGRSVVLEVTGPAGQVLDGCVTSLAGPRSDARCRSEILERICDEVTATSHGSLRSVRCRRRIGSPEPAR